MRLALDRPLDLEDLYATPDDGNRHEVLDGALVVTPPPDLRHQHALTELLVLLHRVVAPLGLRVYPAPTAWRIGPGQVPEPDLMVVPPSATSERAVIAPPLLVVEVLSPGNRNRDLHEKRRIYAEGGAAWYWLVDPAVPGLTVLRLVGSSYEQHAVVERDEEYATSEPFPVRVRPRTCCRGRSDSRGARAPGRRGRAPASSTCWGRAPADHAAGQADAREVSAAGARRRLPLTSPSGTLLP